MIIGFIVLRRSGNMTGYSAILRCALQSFSPVALKSF